jgi:transposase InsO family protein
LSIPSGRWHSTANANALAESFAALKRETLRGARRFDGARACRLAVFRWATTRYNTRRRHSANGQQAPIAYEQQSATLTLTV